MRSDDAIVEVGHKGEQMSEIVRRCVLMHGEIILGHASTQHVSLCGGSDPDSVKSALQNEERRGILSGGRDTEVGQCLEEMRNDVWSGNGAKPARHPAMLCLRKLPLSRMELPMCWR